MARLHPTGSQRHSYRSRGVGGPSNGWKDMMRGRYIEGLKDKPKSGRRSRINEKIEYRINLF